MEGGIPHKFLSLIIEALKESVPVETSFWPNLYADLKQLLAKTRPGLKAVLTEKVPVETSSLSNAVIDIRETACRYGEAARDLLSETVPVVTDPSEDRRWFLTLMLPILCAVLICIDQEMMPEVEPVPEPAVTTEQAQQAEPADTPEEIAYTPQEEELQSIRMLPANYVGKVAVAGTAVYADKSRNAPQRLSLSYGNKVDPVEASSDWVSVKAGGTEGFVPRKDLVLYDKTKKFIALTYDDGPSSSGTKHILDVFEKTGARGTFFMLGSRINKDTAKLVKRADDMGCQVCNHSWDHAYLPGLSKKQLRRQFDRTDRKIKKQTGHKAELIRPPYGAISPKVKKAAGRPLILWSVDTLDWKYRNTKRLIKYVHKHKHNGAVILMHDIHPSTVRAVGPIVRDLQAGGYQLVTVSELAVIRGERLGPKTVYIGQ